MNKKKLNNRLVLPVSMRVIAFGKKHIANTWVHKLPITEWAYRRIFYFGREIGETVIPFRDMSLTVHTKDISMVPALINNNFEEYELDLFERLIESDAVVLDIGANIGVYSLIASKKSGDKGRVIAFEPVPENFQLLENNIKQNNIRNVTLVNKAVGNFDGEIQMEIEKDSIATHHISEHPKNPVSVGVVTIDGYLKSKKIKHVDLIKVDIEGYEGFMLEGAFNTLKGNKSLKLMTELSADFIKRSGKDPEVVGNLLLKTFKYCYFIDDKHHKLVRVNNVDDLLDYKKTNFLFSSMSLSKSLNL